MNLFYLHEEPKPCAELHCDKHVVKMIIEYAQLMSTAHRMLDGDQYEALSKNGRRIKRWRMPNSNLENTLYKASHLNHPTAVWVRQTSGNYEFLYELFTHLCDEYTYRYGREHLTDSKLRDVLCETPTNITPGPFSPPPPAMPDDVKSSNVVKAYQQYYNKYKRDFAVWTKRDTPAFML
jgi:hypothetical protein